MGTNDAPTITAASTDAIGAVTEDATTPDLTTTGTITFDDVDLTDTHTTTVVADPSNTLGGTLMMGAVSEDATTASGTVGWIYKVADDATDYLAAGQTATEKFTVTVSDGHGGTVDQEVKITINGADDNLAPVAVDDVVADTVAMVNASPLTFEAGTYSVDANEGGPDFYSDHVVHSGGFDLNMTVHNGGYYDVLDVTGYWGADYTNAAYIWNGTVGLSRADGSVFGLIAANITAYNGSYETVTGYDHGVQVAQVTFFAPPADAEFGGGHNNVVTFSDPAWQHVDQVTFSDGADYQWIDNIKLTFAGVGPTENEVATGIDVLANDTDDGPHADLSIAQFSGTSALGAAVTLNPDGTFNYDPTGAAALQGLSEGEVVDDTFTYAAKDAFGAVSNTATVTVHVHGRDDAPVASDISGTANEDGPAIVLAANSTDDAHDTDTFGIDTSATPARSSISATASSATTPAPRRCSTSWPKAKRRPTASPTP